MSVELELSGHHHVLAVDDNETNLRIISRVLNSNTLECTTASNGKRALQILEEQHSPTEPKFDLVLLDVMMPGMRYLITTAHMLALMHGWLLLWHHNSERKHCPGIAFLGRIMILFAFCQLEPCSVPDHSM